MFELHVGELAVAVHVGLLHRLLADLRHFLGAQLAVGEEAQRRLNVSWPHVLVPVKV